jgi:ABC-type nickel/cobalt efflux system permease component RcnA
VSDTSGFLLVGAVAVVGVLHTIVPDHWVPIILIARQRGWSQRETALAALQAGTGHVLSTLLIGLVVWFAGVAAATRFGHVVETASSVALIAFGGWIAISAWRELRGQGAHRHSHGHGDHGHGDHGHGDHGHGDHGHGHDHGHSHGAGHTHSHGTAPENDPLYAPLREEAAILARHAHLHRHGQGAAHLHWHDHTRDTAHADTLPLGAEPPLHVHRHKTTARTALLLILGSSPMVEGIPAFFAAGKYGIGLIAVMALAFAVSTIATYLLLCVYSTAGLQRVRLGAVERYGEVMSGAFIVLVGVAFWIWPVF